MYFPRSSRNDHAFFRERSVSSFPVSPSLGSVQDPPLQPHRPPPPTSQPSGGRDASAVESCRWLGHHCLCLEYAHLAASPGGSGPDMEREGGRVRASQENSPRPAPPRACITGAPSPLLLVGPSPAPPLTPPRPPAQPSSAGSPGKPLIALRQPGIGNPEYWARRQPEGYKTGDATRRQPQSHAE